MRDAKRADASSAGSEELSDMHEGSETDVSSVLVPVADESVELEALLEGQTIYEMDQTAKPKAEFDR